MRQRRHHRKLTTKYHSTYQLSSGWQMHFVPTARVVGPDCVPPYQLHDLALRELAPRDVQVCILLQDPYPHPNKAMGRALGISEQWAASHPERVSQSSFGNVWREMCAADGAAENTPCPDLSLGYLSRQGVLLLNTALTTGEGKPGAHARYWRKCTRHLLSQLPPDCVILTCGAPALDMVQQVCPSNPRLAVSHPCRYSAGRGSVRLRAFNDAGAFSWINLQLRFLNKPLIKWTEAV